MFTKHLCKYILIIFQDNSYVKLSLQKKPKQKINNIFKHVQYNKLYIYVFAEFIIFTRIKCWHFQCDFAKNIFYNIKKLVLF